MFVNANPAPTAGPTPNAMPGAQPNTPVFQEPAPVPSAPAGTAPGAATAPAAASAPVAGASAPTAPAGGQPEPAAPWESSGEPFDPARAWNLIQNLRGETATLRQQIGAAQPILDEHERQRRASQSELDTAREDLAAARALAQTWSANAVTAQASAIAATARFRDPADVITMLGDLTGYVSSGEIDTAALTERITALATEKPYLLAASDQQPPAAQPPAGLRPNPAQAQSGTGAGHLDAHLAAAQARGDVMASIALKQQRHNS